MSRTKRHNSAALPSFSGFCSVLVTRLRDDRDSTFSQFRPVKGGARGGARGNTNRIDSPLEYSYTALSRIARSRSLTLFCSIFLLV